MQYNCPHLTKQQWLNIKNKIPRPHGHDLSPSIMNTSYTVQVIQSSSSRPAWIMCSRDLHNNLGPIL